MVWAWAIGAYALAAYAAFEFGYSRGYTRGVEDGEVSMRDRIGQLLYGPPRR